MLRAARMVKRGVDNENKEIGTELVPPPLRGGDRERLLSPPADVVGEGEKTEREGERERERERERTGQPLDFF
jgi:hypothetical protein